MPNIFDYLKWRDLKLEKVEFTEVDNLILSRLAYFPLDNAVEDKEITIKNAYEKYLTVKHKGRILQEEDSQLFPLLANSIRFGKLKLTEYVNKIDLNNEEQFSAVTILMPNGMIYISYRGTDNTIVGWKEDLNMRFKKLVPAQTTAKNYLNKINSQYELIEQKVDKSTLLIIDNIINLQTDLLSLETLESFCNGFKLAIRLITESKN